MLLPDTNCFQADDIYSWKHISCLPFIFKPSPEVTRGWSKLAFMTQTFLGLWLNLPCRGKFAGRYRMRNSSPNLPLPFLSVCKTLVHKLNFQKYQGCHDNTKVVKHLPPRVLWYVLLHVTMSVQWTKVRLIFPYQTPKCL